MKITNMGKPQREQGNARSRFIMVKVLLSLLDPVRGEPTVHSLDRHPQDGMGKLEHLQKKFLDSFALICSTSKQGSETAAAVCLETGQPPGTVLRIARNRTIPPDLTERLENVLENLTTVANDREYHRPAY